MDHAATTIMPGAATEQDADQLLVARYLDGDLVAFDELMTRHERQIYRLCYRFVRNHEDAMDLTQDVFVKAFEKLPSFRGDARFKTWLYRVAVNHCLNHVKKHSQNFVEVTEEDRAREGGRRRSIARLAATNRPRPDASAAAATEGDIRNEDERQPQLRRDRGNPESVGLHYQVECVLRADEAEEARRPAGPQRTIGLSDHDVQPPEI